MYDLPSEDPEEPGLPDLFHLSQPRFLDEVLRFNGGSQLSEQARLELGLGVWQGCYEGVEGRWLRWYDSAARWLPSRLSTRRSLGRSRNSGLSRRRSLGDPLYRV